MDITEMGNRIKKRRTALEMTQKDLAAEMNVSNQLISKWETGESVPSLEYLDALCKALKVDYSYFTSDKGSEEEVPQATQPAKPKKQRKFKWNWKLFIIIAVSVFAAAFIAGFTVLTIYVFVPLTNRKNYLNDIEKAADAYFEMGYYSIIEKTELDGDVKDDYRYDGYFDVNGNPVFHDTKSGKIVVDGILTFDHNDSTKYHYVPDKTYETLEEMALDRIMSDDDDSDESDEKILDKISYIRKVNGGYYLEFKDEYFTDELSGTQKKNYKLTEKIKGKVEIKNGLISYIEVTVKYLNKPDNERFTIRASYEFVAEKPVIEHSILNELEWNGTYIGDKWYSSTNPDTPVVDATPKCEELLSTEQFISRLSGGRAKCLTRNFDFNEVVLNGGLKDGGDCYYYIDGTLVEILNKTDLSKKTTRMLTTSTGSVTNVYVYNGYIFYTDYISAYSGGRGYFRVRGINDSNSISLFEYDATGYDTITYNGKYAIFYGRNPDTYNSAYNVINLFERKIVYSYTDISYEYMDSKGNVYGEEDIDGKNIPVVYRNGKQTILKGKSFFKIDDGSIYLRLYIDGDKICTYENDTVYLYEYGELKETLTTSDVRFMKGFTKLTSGYCIINTYSSGIYDKNDNIREFGTFKLKQENGEWETVYDYQSKHIAAVMNGKLFVYTDYFGGYLAVYDESDLTKPLYYMKKPANFNSYCKFDEYEVRHVGSNTVVAVRINTVDYYGYELYYF